MAPIRIRSARREDAAVMHRLLLDLASALGKPDGVKSTAADIERFGFGERSRFEALLACDGEVAVGLCVLLRVLHLAATAPGVYVQTSTRARRRPAAWGAS
jgi:hypothetical protein